MTYPDGRPHGPDSAIDAYLAGLGGALVPRSALHRLPPIPRQMAAEIVVALVARLRDLRRSAHDEWPLLSLLAKLLRRKLPLGEAALRSLVEYLNGVGHLQPAWHPLPGAVRQLEYYTSSAKLPPGLARLVRRLRAKLEDNPLFAKAYGPYVARLDRLFEATSVKAPASAGRGSRRPARRRSRRRGARPR